MDPSDLRADLAERLANSTPIDAAAPLVRRLLRVAGRVVIDTAAPDSSPDVWPNTKEMALQWIDEALRALGYEATPGGG